MRHVGILAHSAEGSSLCYLALCHAGSAILGQHMHPDITLSVIPMGTSMPAWEAENFTQIRGTLSASADRLKAAGCDFFICPDNTAHLALEMPGDEMALPGLHIAEVVVDEAARRGYRKIGILGTKWTTSRSMYFDAARQRGLTVLAPSPADRQYVNDTIFDELCNGIFTEDARREHIRIINDFRAAGCDAVVLGCTEIPILISPDQSPLPTLDSTRLLAQRALKIALNREPMPLWTGGPVS